HFKNITGSIPQSITKLKHLVLLDLSDLSLSGPVPNFLNQLTLLDRLVLSDNQFSGSVPPNLSDLKDIRNIYLDGNKLTGSIPESYGKFTGTAPALYLARNKLTGPIPKSFGALAYPYIDLSRNKLTGDASMLIKPNHDFTTFIDLSRNQFEFDLSKVKFPKNLNWFDISHNKIFGAIPDEIKNLESLNQLKLGYNRASSDLEQSKVDSSFSESYIATFLDSNQGFTHMVPLASGNESIQVFETVAYTCNMMSDTMKTD
ncbi:polygalacturonase inhibitor 1-like, partial [Papaver somniferum]|uniref:polygalacturonase inhibitor 1-like n=1 Tax=Papaver somniferum TaxID=3469 RepID=UPI000E6FE02F